MRLSTRTHGLVLALPAIATLGPLSPSAHAAEVILLGAVNNAVAYDCSDDGQVVVGHDPSSYWYWTRGTGVVLVPNTIGPGLGVGGHACVSSDGRYMTCSTLQGEPAKAQATLYDIMTAEYRPLGSWGFNCDIEQSGAWGMSADAQHVVGLAWEIGCAARGFSWSSATDVMTSLGTLYFFKPTRANDVSNDGRVIAGWNDDYTGYRQAAAWIKNASGVFVQTNITAPPPAGSTVPVKMREAGVVSGDGQWVFGIGRTDYNGGAPWRWSAATGVQPILPTPVSDTGYIVDSNHDGSRLLCFFGMGGGSAYMWDAQSGYVPLSQLAADAGIVTPKGWTLNLPLAMSEDGLTIVGKAQSVTGATSPFVLDLRPTAQPCLPDVNGDAVVDAVDLSILISAWGSFGSDADLDGDGDVGATDLSMLLTAWGPCP